MHNLHGYILLADIFFAIDIISQVKAVIYKIVSIELERKKPSLNGELALLSYNDMVNGSEDTFLSIFSVNKFKAIHI